MNKRVTHLFLCTLAVGAVLSLAQNAQSQVVVYADDNHGSTFNGYYIDNNAMAGNQINLAPAGNTYLSEFQFQFELVNSGVNPLAGAPSGSETIALSFYLNTGANVPAGPLGYPSPAATPFYTTGPINLVGDGLTSFNQSINLVTTPDITVPQDFTWVVTFGGINTSDENAGIALASPPTVGSAYGDLWYNPDDGSGWQLQTDPSPPGNLDLAAEAETTIPDSSCLWFSVLAVAAGFWWVNRGIRRQASS